MPVRIRVCAALLATGRVDVDRRDDCGYTALASAVEWGRSPELVGELLRAGASPDVETTNPGFTALAAACGGGGDTPLRLELVQLLLEAMRDQLHAGPL